MEVSHLSGLCHQSLSKKNSSLFSRALIGFRNMQKLQIFVSFGRNSKWLFEREDDTFTFSKHKDSNKILLVRTFFILASAFICFAEIPRDCSSKKAPKNIQKMLVLQQVARVLKQKQVYISVSAYSLPELYVLLYKNPY